MPTAKENGAFVKDNYGIKRAYQTSITDVADTDLEGAGTIRWEGRDAYKWVLYRNLSSSLAPDGGWDPLIGQAAVVGYVCRYAYFKEGGYNRGIVTCSDWGGQTPIPAGLLISAPADEQYFWMQIKGYGKLVPGIVGPYAPNLTLYKWVVGPHIYSGEVGKDLMPRTPGVLYSLNTVSTGETLYAPGAEAYPMICAYLISNKVAGGDHAQIICDFPF